MSRIFDKDVHKRYLTQILVDIAKSLQEKIAFKGGTCGAFFYGLPRFSFDLDFDALHTFSKSDIDSVKEIISRYGALKDFHDKEYTLFYLFDYGKGFPNIKIEINKRVWAHNRYKPAWFLGVALLIQDEASIATNKVIALTDRKMAVARDLFDSWYFLQAGFPFKDDLIMERTGKSRNVYLKTVISFIKKKYNVRNVLQGLGETLDDKQKSWVKGHLISDALREISKRMDEKIS